MSGGRAPAQKGYRLESSARLYLQSRGLECWTASPVFPDRYEVSNYGRIRGTRGLLTPFSDRDGYPTVNLKRCGEHKWIPAHRLVALAFHGDKRNALHCQVAHLDGDKTNNHAANLKWVSQTENESHKYIHGTRPIGSKHPLAQLNEDEVSSAIQLLAAGNTTASIARSFNVGYHVIYDIKKGKNWRHVPRLGAAS